jgi:hypothetical protein
MSSANNETLQSDEKDSNMTSDVKRRVAYFYDSEIGNYHYGQGHPMKVSEINYELIYININLIIYELIFINISLIIYIIILSLS